jgi:hypothetical protein
MRLFREGRLIEAEASAAWQMAPARAKTRSARAQAVAERKRAALLRQDSISRTASAGQHQQDSTPILAAAARASRPG